MTSSEHIQYWMIASAATAIFCLFAMGVLL
jgi:hypothetical protein